MLAQDTYAYDDRGLLIRAEGPSGIAGFTYDTVGRLTNRTDTAGTSIFTYRPNGQLQTATDPLTHTTRTYGYDPAGQLSTIANNGPNAASSTRTFGYDDLGRLTSDQLASATGAVTASYGYGRDADGNIVSKTINLPGNAADGTHTYTYDQQDRLTGWTTPAGVSTAYGWDAAGNRTQQGADAYTYDERNRQLTGPDGTNTWTANGNLAGTTNAGGQVASYSYDALSRLISATNTTGTMSTSTYDSLNRLVRSDTAALTYIGMSIKPVSDGAQTYARSIDDALLAVSDGLENSVAGTDVHHDLTYLARPDGTVTGSRAYDPFGTLTTSTGTITSTLGFQSDVTDPTTGDVWMGARWYAPADDTFLSQDSVTGDANDPQSLNRYTYVEGNPLTSWDPTGNVRTAPEGGNDERTRQLNELQKRIDRINAAFDATKNNDTSSLFGDIGVSITGTFDGVTFGLTKSVRKHLGIDNTDMYSTSTYKQSHLGGTVAGTVLTVVDGVGLAIAAPAKAAAIANRAVKLAKALRNAPTLIREAGGAAKFTRVVYGMTKAAVQVRVLRTRKWLGDFVEAARAARASKNGKILKFASKADAREGLEGDAGKAANRFFRDATSKSKHFQAQQLRAGGYRLQFFSPARNAGYGKLYVQEIDAAGRVLREYKDTMGPKGLIERKWVHGGP